MNRRKEQAQSLKKGKNLSMSFQRKRENGVYTNIRGKRSGDKRFGTGGGEGSSNLLAKGEKAYLPFPEIVRKQRLTYEGQKTGKAPK